MLILDGPMGTELAARGIGTPAPGFSAYALEQAPALVRAIHEEHVAAGAEILRTNTFRTQPHVFSGGYRAQIALAVSLARDAAGAAKRSSRVAGSLAPIRDCYRPDLSPPESEARALHRTMASALADAHVDLIVCETFPHAGEARIAVEEAVRTGLTVWIALTAGPDASLMTPEAMEHAARDCVLAGASAVLVNCTAATRTFPYVDRLARIGVPFGAYANAGDEAEGLGWSPADLPRAAETYADLAERWVDAGATILGSCCGTGAAHIAALASRFVASLV